MVRSESEGQLALGRWLHDQQPEVVAAWTVAIEQQVRDGGGCIDATAVWTAIPVSHRPPGGQRVVEQLVEEFMEPGCQLVLDEKTGVTFVATDDFVRMTTKKEKKKKETKNTQAEWDQPADHLAAPRRAA